MAGYLEGARMRFLFRRMRSQAGVTTVEYSAMLVLVALAVSTFGLGLGGSVNSVFSRMVLSLSAESNSGGNNERLSKEQREELEELNQP